VPVRPTTVWAANAGTGGAVGTDYITIAAASLPSGTYTITAYFLAFAPFDASAAKKVKRAGTAIGAELPPVEAHVDGQGWVAARLVLEGITLNGSQNLTLTEIDGDANVPTYAAALAARKTA
jgi:hypothetical protein